MKHLDRPYLSNYKSSAAVIFLKFSKQTKLDIQIKHSHPLEQHLYIHLSQQWQLSKGKMSEYL